MVAGAFSLGLKVKSVREGTLYLNDGIYGGLSEAPVMNRIPGDYALIRHNCRQPDTLCNWRVFGPTCDSLDCLPHELTLPANVREGDYVLFQGLGAYSAVTGTPFNGYGSAQTITLSPKIA